MARIGNSFVRLIMTYGYMLSGTGRNVYVQNLCRGLVCEGHDVHLMCQERELLAYDFVNECSTVAGVEIERQGEQETPYPSRCAIHRLEIGGLLPIYVCDEYPGWRVETFLDLTEEQFENYVDRNVEAARAVLEASGAEGLADHVQFVGPLYHEELAKLLLVADVAFIPSIFPETFGLVAAEFAASGVLTIAADHSGLREAGEIIGRNLPFDLRVGLDGFEENLARALTGYFKLSREERRRLGEIVRHNSVEHLRWETPAQRLVNITGG